MNDYTKIIIEICHSYYLFAKFALNHEIEPNIGKVDKEDILRESKKKTHLFIC